MLGYKGAESTYVNLVDEIWTRDSNLRILCLFPSVSLHLHGSSVIWVTIGLEESHCWIGMYVVFLA